MIYDYLLMLCMLFLSYSEESNPGQSRTKKSAFWEQQRKGANCQNQVVEPVYWQAAATLGLEFVRLIPDAWKADERDFLIGNADDFKNLNERDLTKLLKVLDEAENHGIKIVLTMFSLPGARWKQLNGDKDDARLWREEKFHRQAAEFWRQLAGKLKDHPAIVAYNPLNEPHPERAFGFVDEDDGRFLEWIENNKGTPADLNAFNRRIVKSIRESDPHTPIILDGWFYASAKALKYVESLDAAAVMYAFHSYDPWSYTTFRVNKGRYAYPERMPTEWDGPTAGWTIQNLRDHFSDVTVWAQQHDIPSHRLIASEFGVDRRVEGAQEYLADVIKILNANGWHWAFYAFRGDGTWSGMDYELGSAAIDPRIWQAEERKEDVEIYKKRTDNPLWRVIKDEFQ